MKKELICVVCPIGCVMEIRCRGKKITGIKGNVCEKGNDYATEEITDPKRVLTTTVRVMNGDEKLLSVKTSEPVPKPGLRQLVKRISKIEVNAPVKIGQKVFRIEGVDVVATKDVKAL